MCAASPSVLLECWMRSIEIWPFSHLIHKIWDCHWSLLPSLSFIVVDTMQWSQRQFSSTWTVKLLTMYWGCLNPISKTSIRDDVGIILLICIGYIELFRAWSVPMFYISCHTDVFSQKLFKSYSSTLQLCLSPPLLTLPAVKHHTPQTTAKCSMRLLSYVI